MDLTILSLPNYHPEILNRHFNIDTLMTFTVHGEHFLRFKIETKEKREAKTFQHEAACE